MSESFVSFRLEGLQETLSMLDSNKARKASASALKRMTEMVKTEASSTIRDEYNIKKKDLDPFMKVRLPQWNNLTSSITVAGKPISLMYFGAKQLTTQNRVITGKGGRQLKRSSRTLLGGTTYQILKGQIKNRPHAFIAYDPRLKRLVVWERKTKARDSVRQVNMVTIASLFGSKRTREAIQKKIDDNWQRIFKHELLRAMAADRVD